MPAFVEKLCAHTGIVRAGRHAFRMGDPFEWSFAYVRGEKFVVCKALSDPGFERKDYNDAIRAVNAAEGMLVAYERAGAPPTRWFQIDPELIEGRILMVAEKIHTPHANDVKDKHEHAKHLLAGFTNIQNGHAHPKLISVDNVTEVPSEDGKGRRFTITNLVVEVHDKH